VVALPFAWIAKERRQSAYELQVAEELRGLGFRDVRLGGPYDSFELMFANKPQGRWRDLARQLLGERICHVAADERITHVLGAGAYKREPPPADFKNLAVFAALSNLLSLNVERTDVADFSPLAAIHTLHYLNLSYKQVSDITPLVGLAELRFLYLYETQVSDLTSLSALRKLQELGLNGAPLTNLAPLEGLTNLKRLAISRTPATPEQVESLQKALPNCKIERGPFH
jgi:hypothetical protein